MEKSPTISSKSVIEYDPFAVCSKAELKRTRAEITKKLRHDLEEGLRHRLASSARKERKK